MNRTRWEEREWAGRIASLTGEWREERALADDPNTPAGTLSQIAETARQWIRSGMKDENSPEYKGCIVLHEALAAHPNTPPAFLSRFCGGISPFVTGGFCRNPATPFLLLEQPDFVAGLEESAQHGLLMRRDAPPLFVRLLAKGNAARSTSVLRVAQMHVAVAGEVGSIDEGRAQITDYWRDECAHVEGDEREWHIDLAEIGLAPAWAMGTPPVPEPKIFQMFCDPLEAWLKWTPVPDSQEERSFLRRIDPQLRNFKLLARALRLSATTDDLRDLIRDPSYDTFDISEIIRRTVMRHPSVTGVLIQEIFEKAYKYAPEVVVLPKTPTSVITRLLQHEDPVVRRLARKHPNVPPNALEISRAAVLDLEWQKDVRGIPPLVSFVTALHNRGTERFRFSAAHVLNQFNLHERLNAVFLANATDAPMPSDLYERTGLDLLHHLAQDGNRLVRFIAQTRLAEPNWRFAWHDDTV